MNPLHNTQLSKLLPYEIEGKKDLQTSLNQYQVLLKAAAEAVNYLDKHDLKKFDSLVGENACQIGAIWIAIMSSKSVIDTKSLRGRIEIVLGKINELSNPQTITALMRKKTCLKTVFKKEQLDVSLTPEETIMIESYLLCEMKSVKVFGQHSASIYGTSASKSENLKRFGDVSDSFSLKFSNNLKRLLAIASVEFIRDTAMQFRDPALSSMVSKESTVVHYALPCIPMFWTYKTVLLTAQKESIPIIIKAKFLEGAEGDYTTAHESHLVFKSGADGSYIETESSSIDVSKPALIVAGILTANAEGKLFTESEWKAKMRERSVVDVILAGAADHRQYPDASLDERFEKEREYQEYKALAKKEGFASENPTTFFIQHVYASKVERALESECLEEKLID